MQTKTDKLHRQALHATAIVVLAIQAGFAGGFDFDRDIRPILSDKCYRCHGPDANARQADLRLDTKDGLFADLGGYAAVVPGNSHESELIRRITSPDEDERMPPGESKLRLSPAEIDTLRGWVESGAAWDKHWAFQPIVRPDVPGGEVAIDYFVQARLRTEGLSLMAEAGRPRLLRRVTLDLTGLPPTLEEIDEFLTDNAPGAYERVVDRLLASQAYGERMAWDWLDAARYADSNGFQGDRDRTMWPWRDWVVQSLNENMPYDQFTICQLAGDLLHTAKRQQKLATGFCRNHMINGEGGRIPEENRIEYIFDQTETLGTVWLGLTLTCCRCHDHKYDPLTQREYYQLFALFNQTPVEGEGSNPQTEPTIWLPTPAEQSEIDTLQQKIEAEEKELAARKEELAPQQRAWEEQTLEEADHQQTGSDDEGKALLEALRAAPRERSDEQAKQITDHFFGVDKEIARIQEGIDQAQKALEESSKLVVKVMVMQDMKERRKTFLLAKGLYNQPRDEVTAAVPRIFPPLPRDAPANRLALARWLVDPSHPLTARVAVNRYWQQFFGHGLVKTAEDFGSQGEKPSYPRLLDWLAADFVDNGWDVKALLRRIVMSATYRQTAKAPAQGHQSDPDNRLLARGPRFRLPSWMLRDQALAASGLLVNVVGGPPVRPYQPPGVWAEATFGKKRYEQGAGDQLYRRSLYTFWRRIIGPTMFFDVSKRQTCTVKTARTNTPLHALATLNDTTYVEAARVMAQRLMHGRDQADDRFTMAFRLCTSRRPTAAELDVLAGRLNSLRDQYTAAPDEAKKLLKVGQSQHDEELDAIEHAAYTGVCLLIMNLDETLSK